MGRMLFGETYVIELFDNGKGRVRYRATGESLAEITAAASQEISQASCDFVERRARALCRSSLLSSTAAVVVSWVTHVLLVVTLTAALTFFLIGVATVFPGPVHTLHGGFDLHSLRHLLDEVRI